MIIHQPTQFSCMACVAAMITGDPLEVVFSLLGHDGSERHFRFLEIAAYLNGTGYHLGDYREWLSLKCVSRHQPALLIVDGVRGLGKHAVYWTGKEVLDPEPANAGMKIHHYRVREWWPVTRYED